MAGEARRALAVPRPVPGARRLAGDAGAMVLVASLLVLMVIGVHASHLGDDPAWAFDCSDTTCEDIWIHARVHYRWVSAGALLAGVLGFALVAAGRPTGFGAARMTPAAATVRAGGTTAGALALMAVGLILGLGVSGPLALALLVLVALALAALLWVLLRSCTGRDRYAWVAAGLAVLAGAVTGAGLTAVLWTSLFVLAPLGGIPGAWIATTAVVGIAAHRGRALHGAGDEPPSGAEESWRRSSDGAWDPTRAVGDAVCAVLIALLAAWAAVPYPAPPADTVSPGASVTAPGSRIP